MSGMGFLFRGALSHSISEELRVGIAKHYTETPVRSDLAIIWDHAQREVKRLERYLLLYFYLLQLIFATVWLLWSWKPRGLVRHSSLARTKLCAKNMLSAQV